MTDSVPLSVPLPVTPGVADSATNPVTMPVTATDQLTLAGRRAFGTRRKRDRSRERMYRLQRNESGLPCAIDRHHHPTRQQHDADCAAGGGFAHGQSVGTDAPAGTSVPYHEAAFGSRPEPAFAGQRWSWIWEAVTLSTAPLHQPAAREQIKQSRGRTWRSRLSGFSRRA